MPEKKPPVVRLYEEAKEIIQTLKETNVSLALTAADRFRKDLLLAIASHFEHRMCDCVLEYIKERASGSVLVENFVQNKAITRQYHTWFNWESKNANQFFGLFGAEFKDTMKNRLAESDDLNSAVRAFLEVGNERNRLVHQDYATFSMDKTLEEIYDLYLKALRFIEYLPQALRECDDYLDRQMLSTQTIVNS
ncbi:MAG: hypothetical protein HQK60_06035 [Deltaproteobacteria bacterium]|nr:hypothetical protein [Deltaproteobacteria bacterium]